MLQSNGERRKKSKGNRIHMLENFLFVVNAVLPVFLLIGLGLVLKKTKLINDSFTKCASSITFKIALPAVLFKNMLDADFSALFNPKLVGLCIAIPFVITALVWGVGARFIRDKAKLASFAHGSFRINFAILSLPICINLFGDIGAQVGGLLLAVTIPVYNVLAVILLSVLCSGSEKIRPLKIALDVIKNPFIIAAALGAVMKFMPFGLPLFLDNAMNYVTDLAIPLALITIGGSFDFSRCRSAFPLSMTASIIKTVITPLVFVPIGALMGLAGYELGILMVYCAAPAAVTSYIMSAGMGGDPDIASNIVLYSTFMSGIMILLGIFLLKTIGIV